MTYSDPRRKQTRTISRARWRTRSSPSSTRWCLSDGTCSCWWWRTVTGRITWQPRSWPTFCVTNRRWEATLLWWGLQATVSPISCYHSRRRKDKHYIPLQPLHSVTSNYCCPCCLPRGICSTKPIYHAQNWFASWEPISCFIEFFFALFYPSIVFLTHCFSPSFPVVSLFIMLYLSSEARDARH